MFLQGGLRWSCLSSLHVGKCARPRLLATLPPCPGQPPPSQRSPRRRRDISLPRSDGEESPIHIWCPAQIVLLGFAQRGTICIRYLKSLEEETGRGTEELLLRN